MGKHHTFTEPRISDERLLAASFHEKPIWARGYAEHVKAWERFCGDEFWRRYHSKPSFRSAFNARRCEITDTANAEIDAATLRAAMRLTELQSAYRAVMVEGAV